MIVVGLRPGVSASRLRRLERRFHVQAAQTLNSASLRSRRSLRLARRIGVTVLLRIRASNVLGTVHAIARQRRLVAYAEPDFWLHADGVVPNDPSFSLQWGSHNTGQTVNGVAGTPGADDGASAAWTVTKGSRSIVVGEVDTGVEYTHPDLAANVWSNPGGIGGCAAGTHGYNVITGLCDPMDDDTSYGGHGTHVGGIIGAVGNNGIGVAGMNWTTTILPVKWLNSQAWGTDSQLISALNWELSAKQQGVNIQVINDSATFVGTAYSQAVSDEIDLLGSNGILFVTASGNTGDDNDNLSVRRYPCGYDRPTEICVAASDQNDQLPTWANYGPSTVDMAAPGYDIYSTLRNASYGYISGGSMAAAQVSGAAALILSVDPMSTSALKADILNNVDQVPALNGLVRTGGTLDVCKAIPGCTRAVPALVSAPTVSGTAKIGQTLTASPGQWSGAPTSYAYAWERCNQSGGSCVANGSTGPSYVVQSADAGSTIEVQVTAANSNGSSTPAASAPTAVVPGTITTATFGNTAVGSGSDTFTANLKRANSYALANAGAVSKLTMYLAPGGVSGQQDIEGLIYADNNGSPGALIATTQQLVFSSTSSAGWYDLPFSSPVNLAAGRYWIGVITGGTSWVIGFRYTSVAGSRDYNGNTYTSGPTNPFGTASTDSEQMSLYATYTPSSPITTATFGNTAVGSSSDTFSANRKRVNSYALGSAGAVSKLTMYLAPGVVRGQQDIEGLIYADNSGSPGALIATTQQLVFSSTNNAGWYDLPFSSPVNLAAGQYWIGVITGATSLVAGFRYTSVAGSRDYNGNTYTSGPTNPFGTASTDSEQMSLYATYTPS